MTNAEANEKRWGLMKSAENCGLAYQVLVRCWPAGLAGISLSTRKNKHCRWYHHGLFGTDSSLEVGRAEIAETFRLRWEEEN